MLVGAVWFQVLLGTASGLALAGLAVSTRLSLRSLIESRVTRTVQRDVNMELAELVGRIQEASAAAEVAPARREPLLVAYYSDRELLEDLARQKGIQVDAVRWDSGVTETETEELSTEMGAELGLPGVGGAKASVGTREGREFARQRSRSAERLYNTRAVLTELLRKLQEDGELERELAFVPEAAEDEANLVGRLYNTYWDWDLEGLSDEDPRKTLDRAIDTLIDEALNRIALAKTVELRAVAPRRGETKFAEVETSWTIAEEADGFSLANEWLLEPDHSEPTAAHESVICPGLLFVPLDQAKLTPMGRQRLKPDTGPWLRVFGKIETYDDGTLTILPIVVSSA